MLPAGWIEVECGRIRYIAPSVIGHDGNVIAHLVLHWIAFKRSKRITHRDVGRPCHTAVSAPGVEQLRIRVVRRVSRVQPYRIDTSIGRYRERAEPMPFVLINRIVRDPLRRAKGHSAVRAARKHDIAPVACAELLHRGKHIDIVVGSRAGAVYRQKDLAR